MHRAANLDILNSFSVANRAECPGIGFRSAAQPFLPPRVENSVYKTAVVCCFSATSSGIIALFIPKATLLKRFILPLFAALALLTGCSEPESQEDPQAVFRYNEPGGITSLDPAMAGNLENIWVVNQLFNGLVQMDDRLRVKPCIAERWEISEDGTEYTFHLRDDVYFHDSEVFEGGKGRKVTAQDFAYSFLRLVDEETASTSAKPNFHLIDYSQRSGFEGFVAVDERTFKIFLSSPHPGFLGTLTMQFCSVVPQEAVDFYRLDFGRNPVGTGPFMLTAWKEGSKLIMSKNPNYFEQEQGEQLPYLDAVAVSFLKDRQVEFMDFMQGNIDFMSSLHATFKDRVLTHSGEIQPKFEAKYNVVTAPYLKTDYLGILVDESLPAVAGSALRYRAVRQAINCGFDRSKMVKFLRNNVGAPATCGFVPLGMPSFDEEAVQGYPFDADRARKLLKEAGFPNGEGLPTITLSTTKPYQELCEFLQHDLKDIGIQVELQIIGEGAFRNMADQGQLELFRKSWVADYPDAENFLALFYSKNHAPVGVNRFRFTNSEFDALYEASLLETSDSARYAMYQQMDNIVMSEAPVVPLFYDESVRLVQKNIEGLTPNPMNLLNLKRVRKN